MPKALRKTLTYERLREVLRYDPETGEFFWLTSNSNIRMEGSKAGCPNKRHIIIGVDGKLFYAHRLAWLYMTKIWIDEIDHRDGNGFNNRWRNLRDATHQENGFNAKLRVDNKTGIKGVVRYDTCPPFRVWLNGKYIGGFYTLEEAKAARELAARKSHGEFYREQ